MHPAVRPDVPDARAPWWRDAGLLLAALVLLALWDAGGLDLPLTQHFGDAQGFALREHWLTAGLLHRGGRLFGALLFAVAVWVAWRPVGPWRTLRREERLWCLAATVACLLTPLLLKRYSSTSCPWNLEVFGGTARYVSHWAWGRVDGGPGHCFPSGHASAAFGFLPLGWALREVHRRWATTWLVGLTTLGLLFGVAQMARGAHYVSHTLYTAWLCWAVTALSWHLGPARSRTTHLTHGLTVPPSAHTDTLNRAGCSR